MDSLDFLYLSVVTALSAYLFFINKQREQLKQEKEESESELESIRIKLGSLEVENASNDKIHQEKINSLQLLINDKDKYIETLNKDKTQQIENLKGERSLVLEDLKDYLTNDFKNTSNEVYDKTNKKLYSQFKEYLNTQNKLTKKDIKGIVNPINESLNQLSKANKDFSSSYERDFSSIESLLGQSQKTMEQTILETAKLTTALKGSTKSTGRWGEDQLKRILEMSQMSEHVDYKNQDILEDNTRPDAVVYLPGDRQIVIDSKVSVKDYIESSETDDPAAQKILLASHAQKIRSHMSSLSKKKYWDRLDSSVDLVIMFVPGDNFLQAALQEDPQLFNDALNSKVIITGPQMLYATLKTFSLMWSKDKQTREADKIIEIGRDLYRRVQIMTGHISTLGENIRRTGNSYNSFIGSMDTKFFPKASELDSFYPELHEKKIKKPQLVDNPIKESSKIVAIEKKNSHESK